ncbi:amino acid adenylation domain-containing protein [Flavobacterium sp.]|uniref:amino acid adenylation domain-containing protein n=1 Tax=Flavobacterium sp. TaxID=239 RepID=UPI003D6B9071
MISPTEGYELSENQKNLWSVCKNNAEHYYNQMILEVKMDLSVDNLLQAINTVITNNTILTYRLIQDANFNYPFQMESGNSEIDWKEMELHHDLKEMDDALDYSYNPAKDNPIRFCFAKQSGQLKYLAIRLYSVLGDAYSCFYLCNQIGEIISSGNYLPTEETEKIDYVNYSAWQNDLISKPEREAIIFWKDYNYQTSGTILPFSRETKLFSPKKSPIIDITGEEYFKVKQFCSTHDCEIKSVLLLKFINYLQLFSENEVSIGVSDFKRDYEELEGTLGLVSKTIPLLIGKQNGITIEEAVKEIESQIQLSAEWADFFTLNRKEAAQSAEDKYLNYCFEFTDLNAISPDYKKAFAIIDSFSVQDKFDIKISCTDTGSSISVALYYNEACLNTSAIDVISNQIQKKYTNLFQKTGFELSEWEKKIIAEANDTTRNFRAFNSIVELIAAQCEAFPNQTSLFSNNFQISYSELNTKSDQFKNYLIEEHRIKKGDAVCVVGEGTSWFIISILGIIKAGAYYIPIDSKYPKERIGYIIQESNCSVLVCDPKNSISSDFSKEMVVDPNAVEIFNTQRQNHQVTIHPEDLAYCIYTSGSTGNPKGCTISHSSLLNYIQWSNSHYFEHPDHGNWGLITSISFDLSVTAIFTSLSRGKKLWLGNFETEISALLLEAFNNSEIDTLKLTPSHISLLKELEIKDTTIRNIICGGEQLLKYHVEILKTIHKDIRIYNEYGPTETTVGCIVKEIDLTDDTILIGKPIANTTIYILDAQQLPCSIGVKGEIYIAGKGLTKGYLNRNDLTKEKIIDSPFVKEEKIYKSGDLACWLPNGNIEYFGRIDDQVKIRGYRIELGEIEQIITNQESISQSVVVVRENEETKYLVAYYVSENTVDKKALQNNLSQVLPEYMLPAYYVQIDSIPLTSNGKVDKKALSDVEGKDLIKSEYVAPKSKEEALLVAVWSEVLKHDQIGIKDNFFNLGGDSIKSIQVVSRLKQRGYTLKVEQILRNPVIEILAGLVISNTTVTDQFEVKGQVGLTPIQHDFFESKNISDKNHYNQSVLLKSTKSIDSAILEQSISALVSHHDALRMTYHFDNNSWVQSNQDTSSAHHKIQFCDLRNEPNELEALQRAGEELQSGFDISSGVLFHIGHFRMSDGDRLALIVHHLVIDGVSWRILLEDLSHLYQSIASGNRQELSLKTDSFQRWSSLLEVYAQTEEVQSERIYWEEISKNNLPIFPKDHAYTDCFSKKEATTSFVLGLETTKKLQTQVNGVYNTEINDLLLTGLGLAVRDVFGIEKSMVKMEGHGREEIIEGADVGRTVGWFTSIYPFVLDISNSVGHELVSVKEALRKIPNKGIGYGVLNYLDKRFTNSLRPTIQFNYLGDFDNVIGASLEDALFEFSSENIGLSVSAENNQNEVLLDIVGMVVSGQLSITVRYSSDQFLQETMDKLVSSYENQLEDLVEDLSEIKENRLTPSDLTYKNLSFDALSEWNKTNTIEDIYELSPLQQGLYFHWLVDHSSPMYFEQTTYIINTEGLSIEAVQKAYNALVSRYSILRTSFTNTLGDIPLQIVYKKAEGHFSFEKKNTNESVGTYLENIKEQDRQKGFDFETPSLMRLKVVEIENNRYAFVWSHHHVLMDGWCISILINDFNAILDSVSKNQEITLPSPIKYSEYIKWLSKINREASLIYWKEYLKGLNTATIIPFKENKKIVNAGTGQEILNIEGTLYQDLKEICQKIGITQNTVMQGIWGYLLSSYNDTTEAVFGAVVSGRPGELPGVENMIGLFSNTIPVRTQYSKEDSPESFLKRLHAEALESTPHHYINLSEVQSQSVLGMDLIQSILVFENYFVTEKAESQTSSNPDSNMVVEDISAFEQTNYDFNVIVSPSASSLKVSFKYNPNCFDPIEVQNLASHFLKVTTEFVSKRDMALDQIDYLTEAENEMLSAVVYWKEVLKDGIPKVKFPFEKPRPEILQFTNNSIPFTLDKECKEGFEKIAMSNDGDLYTTMMFLVKAITHKYVGDQKITIGSSFSSCNQVENEVDNMPLITAMENEFTLEYVYQSIKNNIRNGEKNRLSQKRISQIANQQNQSDSGLFTISVAYCQGKSLSDKNQDSAEEFVLKFYENNQDIECHLIYNTILFDTVHITLFIERFQTMAQQLIDYSDSFNSIKLHELSLDGKRKAKVEQNTSDIYQENF